MLYHLDRSLIRSPYRTIALVMSKPSSSTLPDLLSASYEDIKAGLNVFHYSSVDLVLACLARIREINPKLNAVLELNAVRASSGQVGRPLTYRTSMLSWMLPV